MPSYLLFSFFPLACLLVSLFLSFPAGIEVRVTRKPALGTPCNGHHFTAQHKDARPPQPRPHPWLTKMAKCPHQSCSHQAQGLPAAMFPQRRTSAFSMHFFPLSDRYTWMLILANVTTTTKIYYVSVVQSTVLGTMRKKTRSCIRRGLSLQGP